MPDDEVVEHEVVEDDDSRLAAQRVDDPRVRVRVVPDVVERDVRPARRPLRPAPHDVDVDPLAQRRQEQRAVVGDAGLLGRHRAEVGDLHVSSLPMARSHVTSRGDRVPGAPERGGLVAVVAQPAERAGDLSGVRGHDEPGRVGRDTTSSGPPASVVVSTGFSERNASSGTIP